MSPHVAATELVRCEQQSVSRRRGPGNCREGLFEVAVALRNSSSRHDRNVAVGSTAGERRLHGVGCQPAAAGIATCCPPPDVCRNHSQIITESITASLRPLGTRHARCPGCNSAAEIRFASCLILQWCFAGSGAEAVRWRRAQRAARNVIATARNDDFADYDDDGEVLTPPSLSRLVSSEA